MRTMKIAVDAIEAEEPNHGDPIKSLWAAVLTQAMTDCRNGPDKVYVNCPTREEYRERSLSNAFQFEAYWKSWLGSPDFYTVCDYADIDSKSALQTLFEAFDASYHTYLNGIEMRFTKILRERTAAKKAQEARLKEIVDRHAGESHD